MNDAPAPAPACPPEPLATPVTRAVPFSVERVSAVRLWTASLLSFRVTRPPCWHFTAGLYARLGLPGPGETDVIWRPFSMVSAPDDPELEFIATLVPGGAFSTRLAAVAPGSPVHVEALAYGFLTLGRLAPGEDLWLLATGSGVGPFRSILLDPATAAAFPRRILVHSVRHAGELAYRDDFERLAPGLRYVPVVTREPAGAGGNPGDPGGPSPAHGPLRRRIPDLLESGELQAHVGRSLDAARSRVMVCGNPGLEAALRPWLAARGLASGRRGTPGQVAFEQYWSPARAPAPAGG